MTKDENETKKLVHKIKSLLAKTVEAGASEAEAMAAFTKAHELLEQYQLNLSDLDLREEGTDHRIPGLDPVSEMIYHRVGQYCECKSWKSDWKETMTEVKVGRRKKRTFSRGYTKIHFLGIKSDADFAEWLLAALSSYVHNKEVSFMFSGGDDEDLSDDFVLGICARINERLIELINARKLKRQFSTGRDLVPVKNAMVTEAFAKLGIDLSKTSRTYRAVDERAFQAGRQAGDGVTFNRPIHSQRPEEILKIK